MKAYVQHRYGSAERLEPTELPRPEPESGEVLVRVRATSVNPYDWHNMRGEPRIARLMPGGLGLRAPNIDILGCDMAGEVEVLGEGVTGFRPGDRVFAMLRGGGFGEYVSVRADLLARIPDSVSFEQAAAVPMAGVTALHGLRDDGALQPGQRVLVTGASGGIGTFAVQLAVAFGATVTGVCSGPNAELVRSLGADEVVDYTTEDFTRRGRRYDLILDCAGGRSILATRRALEPRGTLVVVGGPAGRWLQPATHALAAVALNAFVSQRMTMADTGAADSRRDLETLAGLMESGRVVPVIDRRYSFDQLREAVTYQEKGHARGKVVVSMG